MHKKSASAIQLDMFSSPSSLFKGKALDLYEDRGAWHNVFRSQITMRINESIFSPLYSEDQGRPNSSIRVLVGMMILKEAEGLSDSKIFENCRYNMLYRSALGLHNIDDELPTDSTYYLFRKKIVTYDKQTGVNLFSTMFAQITKDQCKEFEVSGKRVRMDSKLLSSNIAWLGRYALIHDTLAIHYKALVSDTKLAKVTRERLDEVMKLKGDKVVYTHTSTEIRSRLVELGSLIQQVLALQHYAHLESYQTLHRVFTDQYKINEQGIVVSKEKEEISSNSLQSPYDPDCAYRSKGGVDGQKKQEIKGYSLNITESCDEQGLNLISHVDVDKANTSDVSYLIKDLEQSQEVLPQKIEAVHADGAYNSEANQEYCKNNDIELFLHAIQGKDGRYAFEHGQDDSLTIIDTQTNEIVANEKKITKKGEERWRIKLKGKSRYFTQKEIEIYFVRKKIKETPIEMLQFRNNVEATIFQLGYHYSNAKSRYRSLIKHKMWANIRCLWVNFVRILKNELKMNRKVSNTAEKGVNAINLLLNTLQIAILHQILLNRNKILNNINYNCRLVTR